MKFNRLYLLFFLLITYYFFGSQPSSFNCEIFLENLVIPLWNMAPTTGTRTIAYCPADIPNTRNHIYTVDGTQFLNMTLFLSGLVDVECGNRFHNVTRKKEEYANQYPGHFLVSNGPVNNRDSQDSSFIVRLKQFSFLKEILRVKGALPYAFNYEEEASHTIQLLKYCADYGFPIRCQQAICYGFQGIVCGLHGLVSSDEKAKILRVKLGIQDEEALRIAQDIRLIIAQAPMMRVSDAINCITKSGIPKVILAIQMGLIALGVLLQHYRILNLNQCYQFGACILAMGFLKMPYCSEKIEPYVTSFIMRFVMPWLSPAIGTYHGDLTGLLTDLEKEDFKTNFPDLTLLVTHQKHDEFVGSLAEKDKQLLNTVFAETVLVESNQKTHLYESDEQKAVQNVMRCKKGMPFYDNDLLTIGEKWLSDNSV